MVLVTGTVIMCFIITLAIVTLNKVKKFNEVISRIIDKQGIITKVFLIIVIAYSVYEYCKQNGGFKYTPNSNIVALSLASGVLTFFLAFLGIMIIKPKLIKGIPFVSITIFFAYIMIWAVLFRPKISFFYYYGRYNAPFLIVSAVFVCVIFREIRKIDWIPVICGASIIMYLDYDAVMIETPDDTNVEWEVIEEVLEMEWLSQNAVILNNNHRTKIEWMLILKASGLDVFIYDGNLDSQTDKLLKTYNCVYFVNEGVDEINIEDYSKKKYVKECTYRFIHSEDIVNGTESLTGYPRRFYNEEMELSVYLLE